MTFSTYPSASVEALVFFNNCIPVDPYLSKTITDTISAIH